MEDQAGKTGKWKSQCGRRDNRFKEIQTLILGTCECYLIMAKLILQMWLRILRWGDFSGLSAWALDAITSALQEGGTGRLG